MKNIIGILLIGMITMSTLMLHSVEAATSSNNVAQLEVLQKLIIELQAQLALISNTTSTNQVSSLTYKRQTNNVDEKINKYGVTFMYQAPAACTSMMLDYKISFGDGKSVKADCKGVVDHVYKKEGTYTAKYTKKGKVVATTKVVINNKEVVAEVKKCNQGSLYSFPYYVEPNTKNVCYQNNIMPLADSSSLIPLEAISREIAQVLLPNIKVEEDFDFAFDKNNFYINGDIVYSVNKKTFEVTRMPGKGQNGVIIVNGRGYAVTMTGFVGATLK